MQLGQTAATMQIYDIRRALIALDQIDDLRSHKRNLRARGDASVWTIYAALFEDRIQDLDLVDLPIRNRDAPDLLNVSRFVELPQVALMAASRVERLRLINGETRDHQWRQILEKNEFASELVQLQADSSAE